MIEASVDPGIVRVMEEDRGEHSARYVPDVFFRYKNEYGLDVQKSAKPCFPVEYLLVNVSQFIWPINPSVLISARRSHMVSHKIRHQCSARHRTQSKTVRASRTSISRRCSGSLQNCMRPTLKRARWAVTIRSALYLRSG